MNLRKRIAVAAIGIAFVAAILSGQRTVFSQSAITNGVNYLKSTQSADGSWGSSTASLNGIFSTTAAALEALRDLESTASTNQTNAINFLASQTVEEHPFLAARIIALAGTSSDTSADLSALLARRNADGGWGTAEGYESDVLDTSLALRALEAADSSNITAVTGALNYIINTQNTDGGWPLTSGEASHVFYTAAALEALNSCRLRFALSSSQSRAIAYLRGVQNGNGGYGSPASTPFETAAALLAILGSGQPLTPAETAAVNFLGGAQQQNGSWADDAYSTALALRALAFPRDTDTDGLPDDFEISNGLNPNDPADAALDNDSDGLANLEEFRRGTNPNNPDTDGDAVDDFTEIANGSDPRDPASHNRPPVISSQPNLSASEGRPYSYQVQASDPDGDAPISFAFLQFPGGMSISGAGLIEWTPGSNQQGSFTVIVKVSDGRGGSVLQQYRVSVLSQGIDFAVASMDTSAVTTDTRTLVVGGNVRVDIQNRGGSLFMGSFNALLFEDRNNDGAYQNNTDNLLGTTSFAGSIAGNAVAPVNVRVSGVVLFRDNAIYALVDSANQIPELDETNNTGSSARESRYRPPVNDFQPKVKWEYNSSSVQGVNVSPIVAPLIDTNGDHLVNERDIPAIVFLNASPHSTRLTALRGDTGAVIFDVAEGAGVSFSVTDNVAIGDLDGDGVPEVIAPSFGFAVNCFNNNGTRRWTSNPSVSFVSSPAIVDLEGDGRAEILYGTSIINYDGSIRQAHRTPGNRGGVIAASSQVADLDLDGVPEIITGPAAFDRNGNRIWSWETLNLRPGVWTVRGTLDRGATTVTIDPSNFLLIDSYTAIANLDDDPNPEIIAVCSSSSGGSTSFSDSLWIFEHDGRLKTNPAVGLYLDVLNQESYNLSPPTVADFDGDGQPEIAISAGKIVNNITNANPSQNILALYERDGSLKWRRDLLTVDHALGHGTSPVAAFDFDGDGAVELVHQTGQKLIIFNGRDGATLYEIGIGRNGITAGAHPTIADVDNDGVAEIIVSNSSAAVGSPPRNGVIVFGDADGNWRNARLAWDQYLYRDSREQISLDGVDPVAAPDLTVSRVTINSQSCPALLGITARIGNGGSLHVAAGQRVNYYLGDPAAGGALIGSRQTMRSLYPGEFEDVTLNWNAPVAGQVFVTVNDPPVETLTQSSNVARLPHTWAQASGYSPNCSWISNLFVHRGIDGEGGTLWRHDFCNIAAPEHFYEVRFQFPVNATSITIQNDSSFDTGFLTGTLSFSNGFSTPFTFDSNGQGMIAFPEQQNVTWIRLTAATTRADGPSVSEFIVAGSYVEPQFRIREGAGRLGNNKAASSISATTCDTSTNQPPVIISAPVITAAIGAAYSYQVVSTDPNNDPPSFSLPSAPSGMTINATGLIAWTPAETQTGDFAVTVRVSDGRSGIAEQAFTINVNASSSVNRPPVITSTPAGSVALGQAYQYDVNATDPDDDVVVFSLLGAPAQSSIDQLTGLINWTPGTAQVGTQFFTVEAQDGRGGRIIQSFAVEVTTTAIVLQPPPQDQDGDGFDEAEDCNDANPNINPGQVEIPANGLDDDCNQATPDALPANSVACSIASDRRSYDSNTLAQLTVRVRNLSPNLDITGLQAQVTVRDPGGQSVFASTLPVGAISPGGRFNASLAFSTQDRSPGAYQAVLDLRYGSNVVCGSQISFPILSSAAQGKALAGSITARPERIARGGTSTFSYQVRNVGNVDLPAVMLKITVVKVSNGMILQSMTDQTPLLRGASFSSTKIFNSGGAGPGDYLVILQGKGGNGAIQTVASIFLTINAP